MDLRAFDLNLLLAFEAIASTRSVSLAARRMGIKQPAMSAALARLRILTGDRLFERGPDGLQPTLRAVAMAPGIAAALAQLRVTLAGQTAFEPATASCTFTLACTDYVTAMLVPPLMAGLASTAPMVDLRIVAYEKPDVPEMVARGDIDLAVGVFDPLPPDTVRTPLWQERFVGLARIDHPLLADLSMAAYAAANHVLVSVRGDARGRIDRDLATWGLQRRIALVVPHMLALPLVLVETDYIAAVPERVARQCSQWQLVSFELPVPSVPWQVEMLWRPSARLDNASRWLRGQVSAAAQQIDQFA